MKLDNFVPFDRPQSGTAITQSMTDWMFLITKYRNSIIKTVYRKKRDAPIFSTKNRMSQCTYFENI